MNAVLSRRARQTGLTLVELMIAMVITFLVTGAVLTLYLASQRTWRQQDGLSRVQESGRYALQYLAHDLRMAGNLGCARFRSDYGKNPTLDTNLVGNDTPPYVAALFNGIAVLGWNAGQVENSSFARPVATASPVLAINTFAPLLNATGGLCGSKCDLSVPPGGFITVAAVLPNCSDRTPAGFIFRQKAAAFDLGDVETNNVLLNENSSTYRHRTVLYYVANNSLMRQEDGAAVALIDNVQNLTFGFPDIGAFPGSVVDWDKVGQVDVTLDLTNPEDTDEAANTVYPFRLMATFRNRVQ